jgi:Ca2+-binding RTX toxin-like protein
LLNGTQDLVEGVITGLPIITTTPPPASSSPQTQCFGQYSTIVGTSGDDTIDGTDGPDVISGLGGDDAIYGYGEDDRICGNEGNDAILGYVVNEYISGGADDDWLDGDNDAFITTGGSDYLNGGDGDDQLFGRGGDDILDSIDRVVNNDRLEDGEGDDGCRIDPDDNVGCWLLLLLPKLTVRLERDKTNHTFSLFIFLVVFFNRSPQLAYHTSSQPL